MPCYCDTPNSDDQVEIEKRCKVRMYFDSQELLTHEQIIECEKKGLKQFPVGDVNEHLCKLCQVLNKEQMELIRAYYWNIKWNHKTLYDWHLQHCTDDITHNEED